MAQTRTPQVHPSTIQSHQQPIPLKPPHPMQWAVGCTKRYRQTWPTYLCGRSCEAASTDPLSSSDPLRLALVVEPLSKMRGPTGLSGEPGKRGVGQGRGPSRPTWHTPPQERCGNRIRCQSSHAALSGPKMAMTVIGKGGPEQVPRSDQGKSQQR